MKILTGSLRGKTIAFRPNPKLRPTGGKARKAMFDMLQGALEGKSTLDLFSGTGALGFEALSQGAERTVFVESNRNQCQSVARNLESLGLSDRGEVLCLDAVSAIRTLDRRNVYFDFVFMDPPYEKGLGREALEALAASSLVHEGSLIFFEERKNEKKFNVPGNLKEVKSKDYGDTRIRVYSKTG